ncbi:pantetheine-phosphate adenylyltransferase [bacterium]|nr:pantetheine-phosphate adenylyltransferase [bacterium]
MIESAVYPGTFDPPTKGHLNILRRALSVFSEVICLVAANPRKESLFSPTERVEMLEDAIKEEGDSQLFSRVQITSHTGLLTDWMRERELSVIVRGLRAVSDYEYELQMSLMNKELLPDSETVFLVAAPKWSFVSSGLIKEVAALGGDIGEHIPPCLVERVMSRVCR